MKGKFQLFLLLFTCLNAFATGPTLVSPTQGYVGQPTRFTYTISHEAGAQYYEVEADTTTNFNSPLHRTRTGTQDYSSATIGSAVTDSIEDLHYGELYYWRARVIIGNTPGQWSVIRYFITVNAPDIDPVYNQANNAVVNPATLNIFTDHDLGNKYYNYQVDNDPNFSYPIYFYDVTFWFNPISEYQKQPWGTNTMNLPNTGDIYFRVKAINSADTSDWSDILHYTLHGNVGTVEIANPSVSAFPNPANDAVFVNNDGLSRFVTITDISGKTIITQQTFNKQTLIDVSALSNGIYFINSLHLDGSRSSEKLIIQH
jgi:hypothetical protein